jgi:anti-anti-sigma factor
MSVHLARLNVRQAGRAVVAELSGEIDMSNATELGAAVLNQVRGEALGVILDLSKVTYLDSAGIHVIYGMRERLRVRGLELRLVVLPDAPIIDALRLTGLTAAVAVDPTAADAEAAIG